MTTQHGFELIKEQEIAELNTKAKLYRHVKTGAQFLSLSNDDENKSFGITFWTPPPDATGLPHIMEHSVLDGSRKYPLKEPFVELIKGSLKTFVNASTYPDHTRYPVASTNLRDFYNLIDVYMDAVFYPLIPPHILDQEGWHYELNDKNDPLIYKGVVFNEMKGAYSNPDDRLFDRSLQATFPDTFYANDAGGDPQQMPNLSYEQFRDFHDTYYHPSNSLIYMYGDDDTEERLRYLDSWLKDFEARPVDKKAPNQPRLSEPRRYVYEYGASEEDMAEDARKSMVQLNWLVDDGGDPEKRLGLSILSYILTGSPASPLYNALMNSGLGEDVIGYLVDVVVPSYYAAGLKGINTADADKVEALILETLAGLAKEGIDPATVEAAMNTTEFNLREMNTGGYPRGLVLMGTALGAWLYGGDPINELAFEKPLASLKARLAKGERYFEDLIRDYLINNTHRVTVLLRPDAELNARNDEQEKDRLAKVRERLSDADLESIVENTKKLKELQVTPDSPEAIATIPSLKLEDLDKQSKTIPIAESDVQGTKVLHHDLFTNGIVYLDLGLNLHTLPQEYLPYISLFSRSLLELGTQSEDYIKLSQRIGQKTGGIRTSSLLTMPRESDQAQAWLFLRAKGTPAQADDMLAILQDVLLTVKLDNKDRFRQLALEEKAGAESGIVPSGHLVAMTRLKASFNEADWASEQMDGTNNLFFTRDLLEKIDKDWDSVLAALEAIRKTLLNRSTMLANVTVDADHWSALQPKLSRFLSAMPTNGASISKWTPTYPTVNEGLTIPAQVNYVAKGANLYKLGYKLHGSQSVITNYLRTVYLWERVRVQGGAYGGFVSFDPLSGGLAYVSYRDPNLTATLDVYDGTGDFLRQAHLSDVELTRSIIGAISNIDAYQLPDAKGYTSMVRHLTGITDEYRQQRREETLGTTAQDFRNFADALDTVKQNGRIAVVGSVDAVNAASEARGGWQITKVL
ncbi:MAG: insulinase family protein [Anaerolineae bacterium]|nr:insulinase family protein [Anaerolineae bacterium]